MKKPNSFKQHTESWDELLTANPILVPWKQFAAALPAPDSFPEFVIGQLTLCALALFRDPQMPPESREAIWKQLTGLAFRTTEAASSLGLLTDAELSSSPSHKPGSH